MTCHEWGKGSDFMTSSEGSLRLLPFPDSAATSALSSSATMLPGSTGSASIHIDRTAGHNAAVSQAKASVSFPHLFDKVPPPGTTNRDDAAQVFDFPAKSGQSHSPA
jgi:hypothetical protein